jgi:hypothetical protein
MNPIIAISADRATLTAVKSYSSTKTPALTQSSTSSSTTLQDDSYRCTPIEKKLLGIVEYLDVMIQTSTLFITSFIFADEFSKDELPPDYEKGSDNDYAYFNEG